MAAATGQRPSENGACSARSRGVAGSRSSERREASTTNRAREGESISDEPPRGSLETVGNGGLFGGQHAEPAAAPAPRRRASRLSAVEASARESRRRAARATRRASLGRAAENATPALVSIRRRDTHNRAGPGRDSGRCAEKVVVDAETNPASVEQYRRLAAVLHHAQNERGLQVIMVTSALPGEGKTLTASNLALDAVGVVPAARAARRRRPAAAVAPSAVRAAQPLRSERRPALGRRTEDALVRGVVAPHGPAGRPADPDPMSVLTSSACSTCSTKRARSSTG